MRIVLTTAISAFALISSLHAKQSKSNDYFISASAGYSNISISKDGLAPTKSLNSSGYNGVIGVGINIFTNSSFSLNYQRANLSEIHLDNIYLRADYNFKNSSNFTPFVGLSVGYSRLTWDEAPVFNSIHKDVSSDSMLGGIDAGVNYAINDSFSLFALYQLQVMDHKTDVRQSGLNSTIEHKIGSNINGGFKYSF